MKGEQFDQKPEDTIFSKIADKIIPTSPVYEDDVCYAFNDLHPVAPIHVLIVAKKVKIGLLASEKAQEDPEVEKALGHMLLAAAKIAKKLGVADEYNQGYRLTINQGVNAEQSINYLHIHLMAGRQFTWPPG